jgi:hypothetical protein
VDRWFAALDEANDEDPARLCWAGRSVPKARLQGERATYWLGRLEPDAGPALRLAARAHHLRRFALPRSEYPEGRPGYLRWRRDQKIAHAAAVRELLAPLGADDGLLERTGALLKKDGLGTDPETQVFEDVVSIVFCETELDELLAKLGPERVTDAVVKTAGKMSPRGIGLLLEATPAGPGRDLLAALLAG